MTKPYGEWHYEYIPHRSNGRCWRVGDADDDCVADYETEDEAKAVVREHNAHVQHPSGWKY